MGPAVFNVTSGPEAAMLWRRKEPRLVLLALLAAMALITAAHASLLGVQLTLRADPVQIPADGTDPAAVSVEVLDANGVPVPDGTSVYLITTLGEIGSPVQTLGGVAQTVLTPSNTAGTALVSAIVGAARTTIEVEFTGVPGSASPGSRMVELAAEELSYSPDRKLFVAAPGAKLTYETIEIAADGMQYDVMSNVICAQGGVLLKSGPHELRADALRYDLDSLRGRLLRVPESGEPERLLVEGHKLQTRSDTDSDPCLWYPVGPSELNTWVKARSATINPRNKIILDHAAFYVEDLRVMGLRRHVLDPRMGSSLFGNTLGYSSLFGPNMDIPVYYRASGNQIGSLHITRNRVLGSIGTDAGWALGLKEEYVREGHSEGSFAIEDLTDPDRGLTWNHQFKLGQGSALNLDASTACFDDDSPRLRAGGLTYFRPMSGGRLSLSLSGSDFGTSEHYYGSLAYRFRSTRLGSGFLLSPAVHLRHSRRYSEGDEILIDPQTGEPLEIAQEDIGRTTSPGVDVAIDLPGRDIAPQTKLNARIRTGYAWGLDGGARSVFDARLGLMRELGVGQLIRLDYTYSGAPASLQPTPFAIGRQRLNLTGRAVVKGCDLRFNASQEIGGERLYGYLNLTRPLPWGTNASGEVRWRLHAGHMFSHLSDYKLASSRLSLSRLMGRYRLAVCYSPQGQGAYESRPWIGLEGYGYTYSGGRHLWIELNADGY